MNRRAKTIVFFSAMAAVLMIFVLLSMTDGPPYMPSDGMHAARLESTCLGCHAAGVGEAPRTGHPVRKNCTKCHKK
jgi:hypothetical protein